MEKFKLIPAVHMFFIKDNNILLLKRLNIGYMDGMYSVVAGHLDGEETATDAAVRESKEEAGVEIDKKEIRMVHVMHRMSRTGNSTGGRQERVDFFVEIKTWSGEIKNMEPQKCEDLSWFDLEDLPENVIPYIKSAIKSYKDKTFYSEFGWK